MPEQPEPGRYAVFARYRLVGDEETGVALHCRDHHDDGVPLAYWAGITPQWGHLPFVQQVSGLPELLAVAHSHETQAHAPATPRVIQIGPDGPREDS